MLESRLVDRIGANNLLHADRAVLSGYRLAFNKLGRDRSGKANIVAISGGVVYGVCFHLGPGSMERLAEFEGGYERRIVAITVIDKNTSLEAHTFIAPSEPPELKPTREYLDLILSGAKEHALPGPYIEQIRKAAGDFP